MSEILSLAFGWLPCSKASPLILMFYLYSDRVDICHFVFDDFVLLQWSVYMIGDGSGCRLLLALSSYLAICVQSLMEDKDPYTLVAFCKNSVLYISNLFVS